MAFFGSTQLGYQDTIREHVKEPEITPQHFYRSGMYRDPVSLHTVKIQPPGAHQPASSTDSTGAEAARQVSAHGGHRGSHSEYTRMKSKHIRSPTEPRDTYKFPITTGQEIGQWRKDESLKMKEPWAHVPRHVHVNSEMTRFVDDMSLTNRDFSLF